MMESGRGVVPLRYVRTVLSALIGLGIAYNLYLRAAVISVKSGRFYLPGRVGQNLKEVIVGDYTDLVNVFIGTVEGGHVFPGATVPHGMVKAGLDTDSPDAVSQLITRLQMYALQLT